MCMLYYILALLIDEVYLISATLKKKGYVVNVYETLHVLQVNCAYVNHPFLLNVICKLSLSNFNKRIFICSIFVLKRSIDNLTAYSINGRYTNPMFLPYFYIC